MPTRDWQDLTDVEPWHDHSHHSDHRADIAPGSPRYSDRPLPRYRYLPGRDPHPIDDAGGHGLAAPAFSESLDFPAARADWIYAIDLFNHGFWWEAQQYLSGLKNLKKVPGCVEVIRLASDTLLKRRMGWRSAVAQGRSAVLRAARRSDSADSYLEGFAEWMDEFDRCLRPGGNDFPRLIPNQGKTEPENQ